MGKSRAGPSEDLSVPQTPAQAPSRRSDAPPRRSGGSSKGWDSEAECSSADGNGNQRQSANGCRAGESPRGKRRIRNGSIASPGGESSGRNGVCASNGMVRTSKGKRSRRPAENLVVEAPPAAGLKDVEQLRQRPLEEYQLVPGLDDDLALLCLARVPRYDYDKFRMLNRKFCALTDSGELFKIRRRNGIVEHCVYMVASGQSDWQAFDPHCGKWKKLPPVEADFCYYSCDRESFSVGTQLLVVGRHAVEGLRTWRYDLVSNQWTKGSSMLTPRCLYAWSSCGSLAYVAGGVTLNGEFLQSAERYDPETEQWEKLPDMNGCRKLCAGCYLDGKFYVIGGKNTKGDHLTSAEVYDPLLKTWKIIPNMLPPVTSSFPGAPPLIAVVKNELYALEAETNQLKMYIKASNSWKVLGEAPVRADLVSGWGVAFKSLGDYLLVIGGGRTSEYADGMHVCKPELDGGQLRWNHLTRLCPFGPFVMNCAIISA